MNPRFLFFCRLESTGTFWANSCDFSSLIPRLSRAAFNVQIPPCFLTNRISWRQAIWEADVWHWCFSLFCPMCRFHLGDSGTGSVWTHQSTRPSAIPPEPNLYALWKTEAFCSGTIHPDLIMHLAYFNPVSAVSAPHFMFSLLDQNLMPMIWPFLNRLASLPQMKLLIALAGVKQLVARQNKSPMLFAIFFVKSRRGVFFCIKTIVTRQYISRRSLYS